MYAVQFSETKVISPADGTTYYFGVDASITPTTTAADHAIAGPPLASLFKAARFKAIASGYGSAEAVSVNVYNITQASAELVGATDGLDAEATFLDVALTDDIAVGDQWCIQVVFPAWATDPTGVQFEGVVYITDDAEVAAIAAQDSGISDNLAAILTNDSDISSNLAAVTAAQSDADINAGTILTNDSDISALVAEQLTQDSSISANLAGFTAASAAGVTNDSDISANLAAILANDSDISALVAEQLTQDSSVSANLAAILANDSDISANLASIGGLGDTSAISAAVVANDSDISANSAAVVAAQSDANVNAAAILTNDSDISANLASITALDLDSAEIVILNALLAENPPGILSAAEVAAIRAKITTKLSGNEGTARSA